MRVVDLFCGCGGLSLGFLQAGFDVVVGFDNWEPAIHLHNLNLENLAIQKDITQLSQKELDSYQPDLLIGGPPCQDYSSAGKRDESLGRAQLTQVFAEKVCRSGVPWFVMENVERIAKSRLLTQTKQTFSSHGYGLTEVVLDASLCGVPQKRKRYFLIGGLGEPDNFLLNQLLENRSTKPMTVRDYLGEELDVEHYYRHPRSYQRRGVFSIDEPSPTIRGVNRPIPPNYRFHKGDTCKELSQIRALSTQERARLQTFPKNYLLEGTKTNLEQMIGNAVPVGLARYVAQTLKSHIQTPTPLPS